MPYHSNAYRDRKRIAPNDPMSPLGVQAGPEPSAPQLGIAYPTSHVGGWRDYADFGDYPPPEVTWRLVLDRHLVEGRPVKLEQKATLDGRWVLRLGVFVELAEDAT